MFVILLSLSLSLSLSLAIPPCRPVSLSLSLSLSLPLSLSHDLIYTHRYWHLQMQFYNSYSFQLKPKTGSDQVFYLSIINRLSHRWNITKLRHLIILYVKGHILMVIALVFCFFRFTVLMAFDRFSRIMDLYFISDDDEDHTHTHTHTQAPHHTTPHTHTHKHKYKT